MLLMKKLFIPGTVILSLLLGPAGCMRDYHISGAGDDANPGTQAKPWRTVEKVNEMDFEPGDIILFKGGEEFSGTVILDENDSGTEGQ